MREVLLEEIKKLNISERILLVEEIWDGIARGGAEGISLSAAQRAELDRRLDSYRECPEAGRSWHEVLEEYGRSGR